MSLEIEVIESIELLDKVHSEWSNLIEKQSGFFYQKSGYYLAYAKTLMPTTFAKPFVMVFRSKGEVVAIFPWEKRQSSRLGLSFTSIGPIQHDHINLADIIMNEDYRQQIAESFTEFVSNFPINQFVFGLCLKESSQFSSLCSTSNMGRTLLRKMGESSYLSLQSDQITDDLPKRMVKNMRRLQRKANGEGQVEYQYFSGSSLPGDVFEQFLSLEASGWKGETGSNTSINSNNSLIEYYRQLMVEMNDGIRINAYYLDKKLLASHFCFLDKDCLSLAKVAYLEEFSHLSPSHVLIYQTLCDGVADKQFSKLSFVTGPQWVSRWSPSIEDVYSVFIPKNRFIYLLVKGVLRLRTRLCNLRVSSN